MPLETEKAENVCLQLERMRIKHRIKEVGDWLQTPRLHPRRRVAFSEELWKLEQRLREIRKSIVRPPIGTAVQSGSPHLTKESIMHIEFETTSPGKPTFGMVEDGQMFAREDGLFQKNWSYDEDEDHYNAWQICNSQGESRGVPYNFSDSDEIEKILPRIRRIAY